MRSHRQRVGPSTLNGSDIIVSLAISSVPTKLLPFTTGLVRLNRVRYKMEAFKINGTHISGHNENHPGSRIYADKTSPRPMAKPCTSLYTGKVVEVEIIIYCSGLSKLQLAGPIWPSPWFCKSSVIGTQSRPFTYPLSMAALRPQG